MSSETVRWMSNKKTRRIDGGGERNLVQLFRLISLGLLIFLTSNFPCCFCSVPESLYILMACWNTGILATDFDTAWGGIDHQRTPTERTVEVGVESAGSCGYGIHDMDLGLNDATVNLRALRARNFLNFQPCSVFSRPVK